MKIIFIGGGLGNQMFQYAFRLNYDNKNNDLRIDFSKTEYSNIHNGYELKRVFNITDKNCSSKERCVLVGPSIFLKDKDLNFFRIFLWMFRKIFPNSNFYFKRYIDDYKNLLENNFFERYIEILNNENKNVYFYGYFQSYKYFKNIEDRVRKTFIFQEIEKKEEKNYTTLEDIRKFESISIHVRRGDYLHKKNNYLNVCDVEYYKKSFNYIINLLKNRGIKSGDVKFFIFSNDIDFCKNNFNFLEGYHVLYIDWNLGFNSYRDMQLMSECKHNIIPNSSFSWWGAWLNSNKEKIVIAPEYWFKGIKTGDRCPDDWYLV